MSSKPSSRSRSIKQKEMCAWHGNSGKVVGSAAGLMSGSFVEILPWDLTHRHKPDVRCLGLGFSFCGFWVLWYRILGFRVLEFRVLGSSLSLFHPKPYTLLIGGFKCLRICTPPTSCWHNS